MLDKLFYRECLFGVKVIVGIKHLHERPLCPLVELGIACADLTTPVERETYLVKLGAIAGNILFGRFLGMLTGLDGILLRGKPISVIAHRMKHIEALLTLEAGVDIACYISQGVTYMKSRT